MDRQATHVLTHTHTHTLWRTQLHNWPHNLPLTLLCRIPFELPSFWYFLLPQFGTLLSSWVHSEWIRNWINFSSVAAEQEPQQITLGIKPQREGERYRHRRGTQDRFPFYKVNWRIPEKQCQCSESYSLTIWQLFDWNCWLTSVTSTVAIFIYMSSISFIVFKSVSPTHTFLVYPW